MSNLNFEWSYYIVDEFIKNKIDTFCISPGSRSTPLTVAVAKHPKARSIVIHDERSAAFFALGYAKAKRKPIVLICTSGTALVNYFPALIDTYYDRLPLIVISADRPPELRMTGANQTIDQVNIFSNYVKWFMDIPCPSFDIPIAAILSIIDQAVSFSVGKQPGPVHLNMMFRKPLIADPLSLDRALMVIQKKVNASIPVQTTYDYPMQVSESNVIDKITDIVCNTDECLIIVGELQSCEESSAVESLLYCLNLSVITDIFSGLRLKKSLKNQIDYFDLISKKGIEKIFSKIKTVIHIGGKLVSDKLIKLLSKLKTVEYVQVSSDNICIDPERIVNWKINADVSLFCKDVLSRMRKLSIGSIDKPVNNVIAIQESINNNIDSNIKSSDNISEISAARLISKFLSLDNALFIGNSMPVRDMNCFAKRTACGTGEVNIAGKRGTSGIDGTVACAIGYAYGLNKPVTLVMGDVTLLHDLNSLSIIKNSHVKIILIVINNDGGGIFSFLPISKHKTVSDEYFGAPHELTFGHSAKMFNLTYFNPKTNAEFEEVYQGSLKLEKSVMIEIKTDRIKNVEEHGKINKIIKKAFEELIYE